MDKKLINHALLLGMSAIGGFILYKGYKSKIEKKSGFGGRTLSLRSNPLGRVKAIRSGKKILYTPQETLCMCANNNPKLGGYIGMGSACPCEEGYYDVEATSTNFNGTDSPMVENYIKPVWTV
jgi:hypothetical protein